MRAKSYHYPLFEQNLESYLCLLFLKYKPLRKVKCKVSKIIGFILPDWIADIIPGEYPIHTNEGTVKQNFKGNVLKIVTGDFKL